MVILCASHENESFMLLKFGQISICQNQKLQIPISMVYKPPDMILTKSDMIVLLWKFVMKSHDNLLIQIRNFFSSFTLLYFLSQIVTQIWLYVAVDFTHHIFLFHYFSFLLNLFSNENHLCHRVIYVTKNVPWKSRGISNVFLGWSRAVVLHAYRTILSNAVCHSFLKLLQLVK